jgi:hypothetical protein
MKMQTFTTQYKVMSNTETMGLHLVIYDCSREKDAIITSGNYL